MTCFQTLTSGPNPEIRYVKYNNNWDWSDDKRNTPQVWFQNTQCFILRHHLMSHVSQAYSHYTWVKSGKKLLVCDIQVCQCLVNHVRCLRTALSYACVAFWHVWRLCTHTFTHTQTNTHTHSHTHTYTRTYKLILKQGVGDLWTDPQIHTIDGKVFNV